MRGRLAYPQELIEHVIELTALKRENAVLDLGCGPGFLAAFGVWKLRLRSSPTPRRRTSMRPRVIPSSPQGFVQADEIRGDGCFALGKCGLGSVQGALGYKDS